MFSEHRHFIQGCLKHKKYMTHSQRKEVGAVSFLENSESEMTHPEYNCLFKKFKVAKV